MTKAEQLYKNGTLRPKPFKDKAYLAWMHNQGFCCFVCGNPQIELHHIKLHSNDLKDDRLVIPLCGEEHHRNGDLSPHGNPKKWRETFSFEFQKDIARTYYQQYEYTKHTERAGGFGSSGERNDT